jgi:hypothetical protein
MNGIALAVGVLTAAVTVRGLVNGSGSADGQGFRREDEPLLYWSIIVAGALVTVLLFYVGLTTKP